MRIVARPDFDGIVCAALLYEVLEITEPTVWVEPNAMQDGLVEIHHGDIIANLSYNKNCTLWFDHHESNQMTDPFEGVFEIAPSAAGLIYKFFKDFDHAKNPGGVGDQVKPFQKDFSELVYATDRIDSADLTLEEVLHPEHFPYVLLSMTVVSFRDKDAPYWDHLVNLLRRHDIGAVMKDPEVKKRCDATVKRNNEYRSLLKEHTVLNRHVSITDFRSFGKMPTGNRFLVFSMFPESVVNVKIRYHDKERDKVIVSIGHSIFNRGCNVRVGILCSRFGGGGHRGAGSCSFPDSTAEENLKVILDVLLENENGD